MEYSLAMPFYSRHFFFEYAKHLNAKCVQKYVEFVEIYSLEYVADMQIFTVYITKICDI